MRFHYGGNAYWTLKRRKKWVPSRFVATWPFVAGLRDTLRKASPCFWCQKKFTTQPRAGRKSRIRSSFAGRCYVDVICFCPQRVQLSQTVGLLAASPSAHTMREGSAVGKLWPHQCQPCTPHEKGCMTEGVLQLGVESTSTAVAWYFSFSKGRNKNMELICDALCLGYSIGTLSRLPFMEAQFLPTGITK